MRVPPSVDVILSQTVEVLPRPADEVGGDECHHLEGALADVGRLAGTARAQRAKTEPVGRYHEDIGGESADLVVAGTHRARAHQSLAKGDHGGDLAVGD